MAGALPAIFFGAGFGMTAGTNFNNTGYDDCYHLYLHRRLHHDRNGECHQSQQVCSCPSDGSALLYLGLGHRATDKVEDFGGDFLLAAFVVGQGELGDEVLGVV